MLKFIIDNIKINQSYIHMLRKKNLKVISAEQTQKSGKVRNTGPIMLSSCTPPNCTTAIIIITSPSVSHLRLPNL